MSDMNPENLSCTDLLKRAMPAHAGNEKALAYLLKALSDPGNGKVIHLPGSTKVLSITGPSEREIQASIVNALCATMQTMRLMFAALEGVAIHAEGSERHPRMDSPNPELPYSGL